MSPDSITDLSAQMQNNTFNGNKLWHCGFHRTFNQFRDGTSIYFFLSS